MFLTPVNNRINVRILSRRSCLLLKYPVTAAGAFPKNSAISFPLYPYSLELYSGSPGHGSKLQVINLNLNNYVPTRLPCVYHFSKFRKPNPTGFPLVLGGGCVLFLLHLLFGKAHFSYEFCKDFIVIGDIIF